MHRHDCKPKRANRPEVLNAQLHLVRAARPDVVVASEDGSGHRVPGDPFGFLFRERRMLVRPDVLPGVTELLAQRGYQLQQVEGGPKLPLRAGQVPDPAEQPPATDLDQAQEWVDIGPVPVRVLGGDPKTWMPDLCGAVREQLGPDEEGFPAASLHHVLFHSPHGALCPATEPLEVPPDAPVYPPPLDGGECTNPTEIAVLDTGFIDGSVSANPWLAGIVDFDEDPWDQFDLSTLTNRPDGYIDPYAGHGTFIAGVIRRLVPTANVHVSRLDIDLRDQATDPGYWADVVDELHLSDHVRAAVAGGQTVLSVSAGGPTQDDLPPLSFRGIGKLLQDRAVALVAAAGNESTSRPFWPAAFPWALGVGALNYRRDRLAWYSNYGVNAKVYAPGTGLVNAYAAGRYRCFEAPDAGQLRRFEYRARWSGTSFATPVVAGLIAARMCMTGELAPEAATRVLALADRPPRLSDLGPRLDPANLSAAALGAPAAAGS
jgi:Subtilase family